MKKIIKAFKLLAYVLLIVLASVGLGLGAAVPTHPSKRKEDEIEVKAELPDADDTALDLFQKDEEQN